MIRGPRAVPPQPDEVEPVSDALYWLTALTMARVTWPWTLPMIEDDENWKHAHAKTVVLDGAGSAARRAWRLVPEVELPVSRSFWMVVSSVAVSRGGEIAQGRVDVRVECAEGRPHRLIEGRAIGRGSGRPRGEQDRLHVVEVGLAEGLEGRLDLAEILLDRRLADAPRRRRARADLAGHVPGDLVDEERRFAVEEPERLEADVAGRRDRGKQGLEGVRAAAKKLALDRRDQARRRRQVGDRGVDRRVERPQGRRDRRVERRPVGRGVGGARRRAARNARLANRSVERC